MTKTVKIVLPLILLLSCSLSIIGIFSSDRSYMDSLISSLSPSAGSRYYHRLRLWYHYAEEGNWTQASLLESKLNSSDYSAYKSTHDPLELKKSLNSLTVKPNKSVEDWMTIARLNDLLGKTTEVKQAVFQAKTLDPIRDDIGKIYYQLSD